MARIEGDVLSFDEFLERATRNGTEFTEDELRYLRMLDNWGHSLLARDGELYVRYQTLAEWVHDQRDFARAWDEAKRISMDDYLHLVDRHDSLKLELLQYGENGPGAVVTFGNSTFDRFIEEYLTIPDVRGPRSPFRDWDRVRPRPLCPHCKGTGRAPSGDGRTECGFCSENPCDQFVDDGHRLCERCGWHRSAH